MKKDREGFIKNIQLKAIFQLIKLIESDLDEEGAVVVTVSKGDEFENEFLLVAKVNGILKIDGRRITENVRDYSAHEIHSDSKQVPEEKELVGNLVLKGQIGGKIISIDILVTLSENSYKYYESGSEVRYQDVLDRLNILTQKRRLVLSGLFNQKIELEIIQSMEWLANALSEKYSNTENEIAYVRLQDQMKVISPVLRSYSHNSEYIDDSKSAINKEGKNAAEGCTLIAKVFIKLDESITAIFSKPITVLVFVNNENKVFFWHVEEQTDSAHWQQYITKIARLSRYILD